MSGSTIREGIQEKGMPGKVFPTADHPPENILMGREAGGSPGMTRDGCFPRSQHPGTPDQLGKPPDQPRGPLPKRDGPWEPTPATLEG